MIKYKLKSIWSDISFWLKTFISSFKKPRFYMALTSTITFILLLYKLVLIIIVNILSLYFEVKTMPTYNTHDFMYALIFFILYLISYWWKITQEGTWRNIQKKEERDKETIRLNS